MRPSTRAWALLAILLALVGAEPASALMIRFLDVRRALAESDVVCKVRVEKIADIREVAVEFQKGMDCEATCEVLSVIKGAPGQTVRVRFIRNVGLPSVKAGEVSLVFLKKEGELYKLDWPSLSLAEQKVDPTFGAGPADLLLAELVAAAKAGDDVRLAVIEQIGLLKDPRAKNALASIAGAKDPARAREVVIAQYRCGIAPDAERLVSLLDERVLDVWYEESGTPRKHPETGDYLHYRRRTSTGGSTGMIERGLPDFDYALFLREGIKKDWIRKDDGPLYKFFGVPWKVQRKACVPDLVKLLDDKQDKVRYWAVACLNNTVNGEQFPYPFPANAESFVERWRAWWKERGEAFMAEADEKPPKAGSGSR
jgi:hypothetical protein